MQHLRLLFLCLILAHSGTAQVLGGKTTFAFLDLPVAPAQTTLGSMNVSQMGSDIALSMLNPALLRPDMHTHLQLNYTSYFADVMYANGLFGYHSDRLQTTFAAGVQYINYGDISQTDPGGSVLGSFRPSDLSVQVTASRQYMEKWHYGATLQLVQSRYVQYKATGVVLHVGLTYEDTTHHWQAGLLAKNMGVMLSTYTPGNQEPLPFDLQVGISKKLEQVPLQLSATLHHIYQYDIRYSDPGFQEGTLITNGDTAKTGGAVDKIFNHFVLAAQMDIGRYIQVTAGYNHLRRQELSDPQMKGLSGFSAGLSVVTRKVQVRYARAWYQRSTALNQFGINLPLKEWTY